MSNNNKQFRSQFKQLRSKAESLHIKEAARVVLLGFPPSDEDDVRVYEYVSPGTTTEEVLGLAGFEPKNLELTPFQRFIQALTAITDNVAQLSNEDLQHVRTCLAKMVVEAREELERRRGGN